MECTQAIDCTQSFFNTSQVSDATVIGWIDLDGTRYELKQGCTKIGRDPQSCKIALENRRTLSNEHAMFEVEDTNVTVCDLSSTNKTKLNQLYLKPNIRHALQGNEKLTFGDVTAKFIRNENEELSDCDSDTLLNTKYDVNTSDSVYVPETPIVQTKPSTRFLESPIPESQDCFYDIKKKEEQLNHEIRCNLEVGFVCSTSKMPKISDEYNSEESTDVEDYLESYKVSECPVPPTEDNNEITLRKIAQNELGSITINKRESIDVFKEAMGTVCNRSPDKSDIIGLTSEDTDVFNAMTQRQTFIPSVTSNIQNDIPEDPKDLPIAQLNKSSSSEILHTSNQKAVISCNDADRINVMESSQSLLDGVDKPDESAQSIDDSNYDSAEELFTLVKSEQLTPQFSQDVQLHMQGFSPIHKISHVKNLDSIFDMATQNTHPVTENERKEIDAEKIFGSKFGESIYDSDSDDIPLYKKTDFDSTQDLLSVFNDDKLQSKIENINDSTQCIFNAFSDTKINTAIDSSVNVKPAGRSSLKIRNDLVNSQINFESQSMALQATSTDDENIHIIPTQVFSAEFNNMKNNISSDRGDVFNVPTQCIATKVSNVSNDITKSDNTNNSYESDELIKANKTKILEETDEQTQYIKTKDSDGLDELTQNSETVLDISNQPTQYMKSNVLESSKKYIKTIGSDESDAPTQYIQNKDSEQFEGPAQHIQNKNSDESISPTTVIQTKVSEEWNDISEDIKTQIVVFNAPTQYIQTKNSEILDEPTKDIETQVSDIFNDETQYIQNDMYDAPIQYVESKSRSESNEHMQDVQLKVLDKCDSLTKSIQNKVSESNAITQDIQNTKTDVSDAPTQYIQSTETDVSDITIQYIERTDTDVYDAPTQYIQSAATDVSDSQIQYIKSTETDVSGESTQYIHKGLNQSDTPTPDIHNKVSEKLADSRQDVESQIIDEFNEPTQYIHSKITDALSEQTQDTETQIVDILNAQTQYIQTKLSEVSDEPTQVSDIFNEETQYILNDMSDGPKQYVETDSNKQIQDVQPTVLDKCDPLTKSIDEKEPDTNSPTQYIHYTEVDVSDAPTQYIQSTETAVSDAPTLDIQTKLSIKTDDSTHVETQYIQTKISEVSDEPTQDIETEVSNMSNEQIQYIQNMSNVPTQYVQIEAIYESDKKIHKTNPNDQTKALGNSELLTKSETNELYNASTKCILEAEIVHNVSKNKNEMYISNNDNALEISQASQCLSDEDTDIEDFLENGSKKQEEIVKNKPIYLPAIEVESRLGTKSENVTDENVVINVEKLSPIITGSKRKIKKDAHIFSDSNRSKKEAVQRTCKKLILRKTEDIKIDAENISDEYFSGFESSPYKVKSKNYVLNQKNPVKRTRSHLTTESIVITSDLSNADHISGDNNVSVQNITDIKKTGADTIKSRSISDKLIELQSPEYNENKILTVVVKEDQNLLNLHSIKENEKDTSFSSIKRSIRQGVKQPSTSNEQDAISKGIKRTSRKSQAPNRYSPDKVIGVHVKKEKKVSAKKCKEISLTKIKSESFSSNVTEPETEMKTPNKNVCRRASNEIKKCKQICLQSPPRKYYKKNSNIMVNQELNGTIKRLHSTYSKDISTSAISDSNLFKRSTRTSSQLTRGTDLTPHKEFENKQLKRLSNNIETNNKLANLVESRSPTFKRRSPAKSSKLIEITRHTLKSIEIDILKNEEIKIIEQSKATENLECIEDGKNLSVKKNVNRRGRSKKGKTLPPSKVDYSLLTNKSDISSEVIEINDKPLNKRKTRSSVKISESVKECDLRIKRVEADSSRIQKDTIKERSIRGKLSPIRNVDCSLLAENRWTNRDVCNVIPVNDTLHVTRKTRSSTKRKFFFEVSNIPIKHIEIEQSEPQKKTVRKTLSPELTYSFISLKNGGNGIPANIREISNGPASNADKINYTRTKGKTRSSDDIGESVEDSTLVVKSIEFKKSEQQNKPRRSNRERILTTSNLASKLLSESVANNEINNLTKIHDTSSSNRNTLSSAESKEFIKVDQSEKQSRTRMSKRGRIVPTSTLNSDKIEPNNLIDARKIIKTSATKRKSNKSIDESFLLVEPIKCEEQHVTRTKGRSKRMKLSNNNNITTIPELSNVVITDESETGKLDVKENEISSCSSRVVEVSQNKKSQMLDMPEINTYRTRKKSSSSISTVSSSSTGSLIKSAKFSKSQTKYPYWIGNKPMVMFTGYTNEKDEKIVTKLGGQLVENAQDCSVLVIADLKRTCKLLSAMARSIPVVSPDWLIESNKSGSFLDCFYFLASDKKFESKFGFKMSDSLNRARSNPLFNGYTIHATKSVKPTPDDIKDIVEGAKGTYLCTAPKKFARKLIIISCQEDKRSWSPFKKMKLPIVGIEFILSGLLKQEIIIEENLLC